ncbi:response regulator transcription factor [Enterococcus termitis]|jgi:DNA-binding response OmpR family regulator|uniref:Heme response regulator HssR n=1 Tax=Enterococcus termitis TaxID=332950 RepID=A0A1E5H229_9ENTE|nr:response regulator transcription factor [Enterococcus termitis]OEG18989.1 DNA-binding response regulator [Enterococcus termitis]OJG97420.1 heme response regulator HssR [Enterococcus termitis]
MMTILVVEDDNNIRKLLVTILHQSGYRTLQAQNGIEALQMLKEHTIDLLVLDVMMPQIDGYQTAEEIRKINTQLPIIMVTAKGLPVDRRKGFISGTDDYLVKPIDEEEFLLRIKALLRRTQNAVEAKLHLGDTVLDMDSLSIRSEQQYLELPKKEFQLLYKLLSYPNKIFTRQQLLDDIWGIDSVAEERTIDVHIKRLREKTTENKDFSLVTIRGLGYKAVKHEKN